MSTTEPRGDGYPKIPPRLRRLSELISFGDALLGLHTMASTLFRFHARIGEISSESYAICDVKESIRDIQRFFLPAPLLSHIHG